ncbi:hypothetical protein [Butyrivibrio sp. WCD2001]|uniref:hypothetical protein n=1 Tax=Butyrivibrio sp. WCD2001 TaxID=1280681 RepID=UPI00047A5DE3|nr:hypothetical protein [Butyrivibrio sp. WCD2001]
MKPVEFLQHYRNNADFYYPMIDHERRYWPKVNNIGDINIGWDCGAIGRRPYFLECWSGEGTTMITIFISTIGIEKEDAVIEGPIIYSFIKLNEFNGYAEV